MSKYNELVKKLKEIFQIDRPELDFGIYRILNARADEINDYLDNKLKSKIQTALADAGNANKADLEQQLQVAIKASTEAGFEPDQSPKVQALKKQIAETSTGASEHENAVFSHLLTFFSRYYDNGDFISKRRYKGDTYAIPYAGEEVMLHWANKDQYYIKSGENFANYAFKLDDGRKVSFKLLAADTAKDNRKDNDADRRFVLIEPHTRTKLDEDGEEFEQTYRPVEVVKSTEIINGESVVTEELVIHFEYKAMKKGTKQDALVQTAIATILSDSQVQQYWADLAKRAPTESNPSRTELERHLTTYTQRNTADYFIHKDLGGFLTNELDFYIKNEVMNLDNVQNAEVFANIEKQLRMIQCLRSVAQELITFLAQLENFQKTLWEKKKLVVSSDYCISLIRLPLEILPEIVGVSEQWEQWLSLSLISKKAPRTLKTLEDNPYLVVDTSVLPKTLKYKVVNAIDEIEDELNGILINSDNFQALNFLKPLLSEKLDCIYIDPPYNTSENAFLYKNNYKHSSWNCLMNNTTPISSDLLKQSGVMMAAIDDTEYSSLKEILKHSYGEQNYAGTIAIEINPAGQNIRPNLPARSHDYCHIFAKDIVQVELISRGLTMEEKKAYKEKDDTGAYYWDNLRRRGGNSRPTDRPKQWFPLYVNGRDVRVPDMQWNESRNQWQVNEAPAKGETEVWPIDPKGIERIWRVNPDGARREIFKGEIEAIQKAGRIEVSKKSREPEGKKPKTLWSDSIYSATSHGSKHLINLFGDSGLFSYPKSINLVTDSLRYWAHKSAIVLDYFAGSGTTGESVLRLNLEDEGKRKFILVEQGQYFDIVTKPRVIKCAYANKWKNGSPIDDAIGSAVILKVIKLESYEDTLNNISLSKKNADLFELIPSEASDEYLLKYMLEEESKGSLLNIDNFCKPFDYQMNIATDSAGATECKTVDLVETFNFLIGLHVKSIESNIERGYVRVEGTLPSGERTLILWRDCDKIGYEKLNEYANRFDVYAKEQTFDVIYINGDHNLPTAFTVDGEDGEVLRSLKLRQIEPEFLSLMFAEEI